MFSLDEALAFPLPAANDGEFEFGFGFTPWAAPESGPAMPEPDRPASEMSPEERRRLRRMISNRESARRSRARKQRHLEELRAQAARLRSENRDLSGQIAAVAGRCLLFRHHNDRLRAEHSALANRLAHIRRLLLLRHLHLLASAQPQGIAAGACGGFETGFEPTLASLIA